MKEKLIDMRGKSASEVTPLIDAIGEKLKEPGQLAKALAKTYLHLEDSDAAVQSAIATLVIWLRANDESMASAALAGITAKFMKSGEGESIAMFIEGEEIPDDAPLTKG